jgi:prepilin peptidase CpaA
MKLLTLPFWPMLVISILMIVAAVIDGWKLRVPNWLTFPMILSGWLLAGAYGLGWLEAAPGTQVIESGWDRLLGSLFLTLIAMLTLGVVWVIGAMGAGDVKMQMGFGSWVGAFFGRQIGLEVFFPGFIVGVIVGGFLGIIIMLINRRARDGGTNLKALFTDLMLSGLNLAEIQARGKERKQRQVLLPYGIPLCIGFVGYLIYYLSQ